MLQKKRPAPPETKYETIIWPIWRDWQKNAKQSDAPCCRWSQGNPSHVHILETTMKLRRRAPALSKAELRAQGEHFVATAGKPIVKLPTKLVRTCGRCGEPTSVMVEPGHAPPKFECKHCGP